MKRERRRFRARKRIGKETERVLVPAFSVWEQTKNKLQFVQMFNTHDRMIGRNKNRTENTTARLPRIGCEAAFFSVPFSRCQMCTREHTVARQKEQKRNIIKINQLRYTAWTLIYYTLALATDIVRSMLPSRCDRFMYASKRKFKIHPMRSRCTHKTPERRTEEDDRE